MPDRYRNQDWLFFLHNRMIRDSNTPDSYELYGTNKVRFITFNYDRSLEHYIYSRFANSFSQENLYDQLVVSPPLRKHLVPFEFIHVYGKVDEIPLEGGSDYRSDFDFETAEKLFQNIRVIGERVDENIDLARHIISNWAKRIFFLGFGYDPMNLKVLDIPNILNEDHKIYGTAFNASDKRRWDILNMLKIPRIDMSRAEWDQKIRIRNMNCYQLLDDFL